MRKQRFRAFKSVTPDNTASKQFYAGISAQSVTDRGFIPEFMIFFYYSFNYNLSQNTYRSRKNHVTNPFVPTTQLQPTVITLWPTWFQIP